MIRILACFVLWSAPFVFAQGPENTKGFSEALKEFSASPEYQSTEAQLRSIQYDFESREIVLEPQLQLSAVKYRDEREGYVAATKKRSQLIGLTLSKPFSTGTEVSISPSWEKALLPTLTPDEQNDADWQVALTQDLWQDFFGRSTRLRRARENFERRQQIAGALLRRAQLLVDFENLYWDWASTLREQELRLKNYKRSQEIYNWVRGRFRRSAAEATDLLQAEALMTNRRLQLETVNQVLVQAEARMQRYLPGHTWRPKLDDLASDRQPEGLVAPWHEDSLSRPLKLEFLQTQNESEATDVRADEAREAIRPQLKLQLIYGRNGVDTEASTASRQSFNEHHEYTSVGVALVTGLDLSSEYKAVESARAAHAAAERRAAALQADARVAWQALQDQVRDLRTRIETARGLVQTQLKKNDAEKVRYRTGRTTAFEAITFEQDAADAEISLWTLYTLLRKAEAQARLFAR
jgi:outer membrane protein TolC